MPSLHDGMHGIMGNHLTHALDIAYGKGLLGENVDSVEYRP